MGDEFVALAEYKNYPFYFSQFHPEKHQYEKKESYNSLDRSEDTIRLVSSYAFKLASIAKEHAKSLDSIPKAIQSYFSGFNTPIISPVKSFQRIYVFKTFFAPKKPQTLIKKLISKIKKKLIRN